MNHSKVEIHNMAEDRSYSKGHSLSTCLLLAKVDLVGLESYSLFRGGVAWRRWVCGGHKKFKASPLTLLPLHMVGLGAYHLKTMWKSETWFVCAFWCWQNSLKREALLFGTYSKGSKRNYHVFILVASLHYWGTKDLPKGNLAWCCQREQDRLSTHFLCSTIFFSLTILPQFQTSKAPYVWKGSRGEDPCLRLPKGARWMMDTLSTLVLEDPYNQSVYWYIYVLSYNHFTTTIDQSKKEAKVETPACFKGNKTDCGLESFLSEGGA